MIVSTKMNYLGYAEKVSGKTGKAYILANFQDEDNELFIFYVSGEDTENCNKINTLKKFAEATIELKISSYKGEARIDLAGVK